MPDITAVLRCRRSLLTALAVFVLSAAPASGETGSLSIARARAAIRTVATLRDHPTSLRISNCHQLSPVRVRCQLVEEVVSMPTEAEPEALGVIEVREGPVLVTLEHHRHPSYTYLRVRY